MKIFITAAIGAAMLSAAPASAALTTITFENLSNYSYVSGYSGVSFNGFLASNNTHGGAVIVPSGSIYIQALGTAQIAFGGANPNGTVDYVSFSNGGLTSGSTAYDGFTVRAYDANTNLLATQTVSPAGPNVGRGITSTTFSVAGIHSLVFAPILNPNSPNGSYIGLAPIDDLVFGSSEAAAPVPEAGEWAMLALGLTVVGGVARRRRG